MIARSAMHFALQLLDVRVALTTWVLAVEELQVMKIRHRLLETRIGILAVRQAEASKKKAELEMQRVIEELQLDRRYGRGWGGIVTPLPPGVLSPPASPPPALRNDALSSLKVESRIPTKPKFSAKEDHLLEQSHRIECPRRSFTPVTTLTVAEDHACNLMLTWNIYKTTTRCSLVEIADKLGVAPLDLVEWNKARYSGLKATSLIAQHTILEYRRRPNPSMSPAEALLFATIRLQSAWRGKHARMLWVMRQGQEQLIG